MTMMTASDATAYCLAIAQLIPVFLIALYIVDYRWVMKSEKDATRAAGLKEGYAKRAVQAILVGIVGEIVVLGGALGLISRLVAIAAGTGIVVYVIGILSEPAIDRLTWQITSRIPAFLRNHLLPIVIVLAIMAFVYILVRLRISP